MQDKELEYKDVVQRLRKQHEVDVASVIRQVKELRRAVVDARCDVEVSVHDKLLRYIDTRMQIWGEPHEIDVATAVTRIEELREIIVDAKADIDESAQSSLLWYVDVRILSRLKTTRRLPPVGETNA